MAEPESPRPYISLRSVSKSYRIGSSRVSVFQNLDLAIPKGDFVAVMGPSGSGKSTLLNLLGGIDRADSGSVSVGDAALHSMSEGALTAWRARHVGIVFQFYNLLPMLTAEQNVELPLLLRSLTPRLRRERVQTVLDLVGLNERRRHRPGQLSGGQQQRIGIARALVADPELLLCDEPTGDLDRDSAREVMEMLKFLNRDLGKTIVMVTHDPEMAQHATRTLHLVKGVFEDREAAA